VSPVRPRDRRAVRHAALSGAPDAGRLRRQPRAVIVGGGIAGLAAAAGLVERGSRVTVLEREPQLGGRVAGWTETADGARLPMSRGFHAFFRQYYNLRALLRRADPDLTGLVSLDDYPLVDADGRKDSFRGLPRTPPWNAAAFALRSPTFGLGDLLAINPAAAAPLMAVSVPDTYRRLDHLDAETFLRQVNFPAAARHLAFDVFSRSFFALPSQMSAAELAVMFHIYFLGSNEGLIFDVPRAGFDQALWEPLRGYLATCGADIRTGVTVTRVDHAGSGGFLVHRLWLDRPVNPGRPAFLAVGGLPPLDNISVLDRYDSQARSWAARNAGSVVELHAYAADDAGAYRAATRDRTLARMRELYPETKFARVVAESVLWRQDCPLFGTGDFQRRPRVRTPFGGLMLAGDGIRIDLPTALMERAATTGWHAANCLLARWGLAGHDLYTVPVRGRVGPLHWLATRGARHEESERG
jgi:isorenieratene synthase